MTMLDTGIRPGEALLLLISDIGLDKLEITVRGGEVSKTSTEMRLPCSLLIGKQFRVYLDTLSDMNAQKTFPDDSGGDLSMSSLYKFFQLTSRKSGVKVTAYCLRHTFALHSLRNGADPFWIQTMMGHSDLSMTKRYIAFMSKDLRDTQRRVSLLSKL